MAQMAGVDFGILAGAGAPTRNFKAGDVIFSEGDPAQEFYTIKSGGSTFDWATGFLIRSPSSVFLVKWR
jgi:hypothetical protein